MGKATILDGGDDGKYSIKVDYGKAVGDARVARANARLLALAPEIATAQTKLDAQNAIEASKKPAVDAAIVAFVAASSAVPRDPAAVADALKKYSTKASELNKEKGKTAKLRVALEALKTEKAQLQKDEAYWRGLKLEETMDAWCVDLTEDGKDDVATIEIPGESKHFLIAPEARKPADSDGVIVAREVQSAAQVFFNAAILPGWQKYNPTYRAGTITAIDYAKDTAEVTLSTGDVSSAQKLDINQKPVLENVPIEYMNCNAAAFDLGDQCVVQFEEQDWDKPKVIGFFDNPRPCGSGIGVAYDSADGTKYAILTPSGKYRAPTGNWKMKGEKSLVGGAYPWASDQIGEYAVSTGNGPQGRKYSGVAVVNKRATSVTWTFGGVAGGDPYVAQVTDQGSRFLLYVARSPKRLRSLRAYKLQDQSKAFAIDIPAQDFTGYQVSDVSSDGARVLGAKLDSETPPAYLAPVGYRCAVEALLVTIALPVASSQEYQLPEPVITTQVPAGRPDAPGNDDYFASKSPLAVRLTATNVSDGYAGNTSKTWYRRLDMEIPRAIHYGEENTGLFFRPDGGVGQDIVRLVQERDGTVTRENSSTNSGGDAPTAGEIDIITGRASQSLNEFMSCEIGASVFDIFTAEMTDSGTYDFYSVLSKVEADTNFYKRDIINTRTLTANIADRQIKLYDRQLEVLVYIEYTCNSTYTRGWSFASDGETFLEDGVFTTIPPSDLEDNEAALVIWKSGAEIYRKKFNGVIHPNRKRYPITDEPYVSIRGYDEDDASMAGESNVSYTTNTLFIFGLVSAFSYVTEAGEDFDFEIKSAKDPYTGALIVHTNMKNDGFGLGGGAESKWFVFDGAGVVKNISDISDIPPAAIPTVLISV